MEASLKDAKKAHEMPLAYFSAVHPRVYSLSSGAPALDFHSNDAEKV